MKLLMQCMTCLRKLDNPKMEFTEVEFRDDGRYVICCPHGHESVTVLQEQKFEILFDIGANAIIDGYYREAISSFTSSLERFYEFCINIFCEHRSLDDDVYKKTWKQVSNQSERQLGAFLFLWANELGEIPILLSNDDIKLRNEVIHKGKIPTKEEALEYGKKVLQIIRPKIKQLRTQFPDEISAVTFKHIQACSSVKDCQISGGTMSVRTIISLTSGEESHNSQTLEDALASIVKLRKISDNLSG